MTYGLKFMAILIAFLGGGVAIGITIAEICNSICNLIAKKKGNK